MDNVPDWKGSPTKSVNKSPPNLTVSINGRTVLHERKCFKFSEYSYTIKKISPVIFHFSNEETAY